MVWGELIAFTCLCGQLAAGWVEPLPNVRIPQAAAPQRHVARCMANLAGPVLVVCVVDGEDASQVFLSHLRQGKRSSTFVLFDTVSETPEEAIWRERIVIQGVTPLALPPVSKSIADGQACLLYRVHRALAARMPERRIELDESLRRALEQLRLERRAMVGDEQASSLPLLVQASP